MKKVMQVIGVGVVTVFALAGVLMVAVILTTEAPQNNQAGAKTEKVAEAKPQAKPEAKESSTKESEATVATEEVVEVDASDAIAGAQSYYDAASAGDFGTTYALSGIDMRSTYTESEWFGINDALSSAGASYVVQDAIAQSDGTYQVEVLVNGTPRTTYFVLDGGEWYHLPTAEEYALYDSGLGGSAPASASAPATTAAPSSATASSGEVEVTVEVTAQAPVDVSIMSIDDMGVPMIMEQVQSATYTFSKNANADLMVDASDPNMDFTSDEAIHVAVYEYGELVSEDYDADLAMVSY